MKVRGFREVTAVSVLKSVCSSPADPSLSDQGSYQHHLCRRRAVTGWLMQAAAPEVEREVAAAGDTVCWERDGVCVCVCVCVCCVCVSTPL